MPGFKSLFRHLQGASSMPQVPPAPRPYLTGSMSELSEFIMTKASVSLDQGFPGKPALCQAGAAGPLFPLDCCPTAVRPDGRAPDWPSVTRARGRRQRTTATGGETALKMTRQGWWLALVPKQLSPQGHPQLPQSSHSQGLRV